MDHKVKQRLYAAEYRKRPGYKEHMLEYRKKNRLKANAASKAWADKHRHITRARSRVHSALRTGKLKKKPCEHCGESKVQAHHEDYSYARALDVIWLCRSCHRKLHDEKNIKS